MVVAGSHNTPTTPILLFNFFAKTGTFYKLKPAPRALVSRQHHFPLLLAPNTATNLPSILAEAICHIWQEYRVFWPPPLW